MPPLGSCRATPTCRQGFQAAECRDLLSCLPPLPLAGAPDVGGPATLRCLQPARRRTRQWPQAGRVRGKTPAHGKAARSAARMRSHCTRDDTRKATGSACPMARQDARQRTASRRPSWASLQPDRMRDADHGGCADRAEIPAVERGRIRHAQQEQFASFKTAAKLQRWQRPAQPVDRQRGGRRHAVDANLTGDDANVLRRDCAHTFEQRHAGRQVAALRSERGSVGRQSGQDDAADRQRGRPMGRAAARDTSRPPRCRTGCRSGAAAAARRTPRPAQRGCRRTGSPVRGERANVRGASEDAARRRQ